MEGGRNGEQRHDGTTIDEGTDVLSTIGGLLQHRVKSQETRQNPELFGQGMKR